MMGLHKPHKKKKTRCEQSESNLYTESNRSAEVPVAVAAVAVCGRGLLSATALEPAALASFSLALAVRCFTLAQPAASLVLVEGLLFVDGEEQQGDDTCRTENKKIKIYQVTIKANDAEDVWGGAMIRIPKRESASQPKRMRNF